MGKVNITEILNYISNYQLTDNQKMDLLGNENKTGKVYDYILKDIQKKFGLDFSEHFEICYNVTEIADLLVAESGLK